MAGGLRAARHGGVYSVGTQPVGRGLAGRRTPFVLCSLDACRRLAVRLPSQRHSSSYGRGGVSGAIRSTSGASLTRFISKSVKPAFSPSPPVRSRTPGITRDAVVRPKPGRASRAAVKRTSMPSALGASLLRSARSARVSDPAGTADEGLPSVLDRHFILPGGPSGPPGKRMPASADDASESQRSTRR